MQKIGLVQFAPVFGDIDANIALIETLIDNQEADIWVLPELASTGYAFNDIVEAKKCAETVDDSRFLKYLKRKSSDTNSYFIAGFCELHGAKLFNSSALIGPDGLVGIYRKLHLFWNEKRIFTQGDLGLPVFETPHGIIGLTICYDWMFPEAWRVLSMKGAQLIGHCSNLVMPYAQSVVPNHALINKMFIATANRTGSERGLTFTGKSVFCTPSGETLITASQTENEVVIVEVDLTVACDKTITPLNNLIADRRSDVYGNLYGNHHQ